MLDIAFSAYASCRATFPARSPTRRTQTNRRIMVRKEYQPYDFDFALVYLPECNLFYIFPLETFISYGSEIHMVEVAKRQRRPRSWVYREAWHALEILAQSRRTNQDPYP